jgi:hypothetical protein
MTKLTFEELVSRFNTIIKAFDQEMGDPQLEIRMRTGWKDRNARFYAALEHTYVDEGDVLHGTYGNGSTPEEALYDYYDQIVGETLVYTPVGKDEKEVTVV